MLVVIGAHVLVPKVQKDSQPAVALHHVGFAFVTEFLVISGFLITLLLIRERDKTGTIALWKFYKRRVIRLWPALWVVVGTTAVIGWLGYVQVDAENLLTPLFFVTNYFDQNGNAVLGHTWSLALEEQFYLIWPLAIIVLGRKNLPRTLAILILIAPIVRIASYYMIPALRGTMQYQFHIRYDAMAMGCLLAITWGHPRVQRFMAKPGPWGWLAAVGLFVSLGGELLGGQRFLLTVGYSVQSLCLVTLTALAVYHYQGKIGKALNLRLFVGLGLMSYSLYLWQQMFVLTPWGWLEHWPVALAVTFVVGIASYHVLEKPFMKMGRKKPVVVSAAAEGVPLVQAPSTIQVGSEHQGAAPGSSENRS